MATGGAKLRPEGYDPRLNAFVLAGSKRPAPTSVVSSTSTVVETTFVAPVARTHSYPAAVDVRWASATHVLAARAVEPASYW